MISAILFIVFLAILCVVLKECKIRTSCKWLIVINVLLAFVGFQVITFVNAIPLNYDSDPPRQGFMTLELALEKQDEQVIIKGLRSYLQSDYSLTRCIQEAAEK